MPKVIEPYKHDCTHCKWVGWVCIKDQVGNMYVCEKTPRLIEIIIRWSDEGPDYSCHTANLDSTNKPYAVEVMD